VKTDKTAKAQLYVKGLLSTKGYTLFSGQKLFCIKTATNYRFIRKYPISQQFRVGISFNETAYFSYFNRIKYFLLLHDIIIF